MPESSSAKFTRPWTDDRLLEKFSRRGAANERFKTTKFKACPLVRQEMKSRSALNELGMVAKSVKAVNES